MPGCSRCSWKAKCSKSWLDRERIMPQYILTVNGTRRTLTAAPDTPLLWVLRDTLGMTGTKFGCGGGYCGACTVHLDGAAVRSCLIQIKDAAHHRVTTI